MLTMFTFHTTHSVLSFWLLTLNLKLNLGIQYPQISFTSKPQSFNPLPGPHLIACWLSRSLLSDHRAFLLTLGLSLSFMRCSFWYWQWPNSFLQISARKPCAWKWNTWMTTYWYCPLLDEMWERDIYPTASLLIHHHLCMNEAIFCSCVYTLQPTVKFLFVAFTWNFLQLGG